MEGGAMAGYCAMGRERIASAPATMRTMAITQAKIGRLMKNLDIMRSCIYQVEKISAQWKVQPRAPERQLREQASLRRQAAPIASPRQSHGRQARCRRSRAIDRPRPARS